MHFRKFYLLLPAEVKVEKKKDVERVYKTILSSFFRNNTNSLSQFINTFKKYKFTKEYISIDLDCLVT